MHGEGAYSFKLLEGGDVIVGDIVKREVDLALLATQQATLEFECARLRLASIVRRYVLHHYLFPFSLVSTVDDHKDGTQGKGEELTLAKRCGAVESATIHSSTLSVLSSESDHTALHKK
jgi:hypothetical protein